MPRPFAIRTRRGAYAALVILTIFWGMNWAAMKAGLRFADPIAYNMARTLLAVVFLFAILLWERRAFWPASWIAVVVTGFFQTTLNFSATTMALASGGAGRTSVLVFTMPFWTMLIAWPVLDERVRGTQWLAVAFALVGLVVVVEPWNWQGDLAPKLWATLSGFAWGAGTVTTKYYQRRYHLDVVNLITWQMAMGSIPIIVLAMFWPMPATQWTGAYVMAVLYAGVVSTGLGFILWTAVLGVLPAGTASLNMFAIPVIAIVSSMLIFGERIPGIEWLGIALIGIGLVILSLRAWWEARRDNRDDIAAPAIETG